MKQRRRHKDEWDKLHTKRDTEVLYALLCKHREDWRDNDEERMSQARLADIAMDIKSNLYKHDQPKISNSLKRLQRAGILRREDTYTPDIAKSLQLGIDLKSHRNQQIREYAENIVEHIYEHYSEREIKHRLRETNQATVTDAIEQEVKAIFHEIEDDLPV